MPQTTPPGEDDEFIARAMAHSMWTYPYDLISLGIVDYVWPVLQEWGQQAVSKWGGFVDKIKQWFAPSTRRHYTSQQQFLDALWTAADWAADECSINDWRGEWPSLAGA